MKKIQNTLKLVTLLFFLVAFTNPTKYDPSGIWDYEIEVPEQGTQTGEMTIEKNGQQYEVSIVSALYGTLELEKVKFKDNELEGTVEVAGGIADFTMQFDGDSMEGSVYFGESELDITAKRKKK